MLNCVHGIIVNDRKNIILAIVHPMSWNVKKKSDFFFLPRIKTYESVSRNFAGKIEIDPYIVKIACTFMRHSKSIYNSFLGYHSKRRLLHMKWKYWIWNQKCCWVSSFDWGT
jgi:hypothetical protein